MSSAVSFQIGKSGVTPGVLSSLAAMLKSHYQVRISLLRSSGRTRGNILSIAEDICSRLPKEKGKDYAFRIIGFTIILSKISKREKK